MKTNYLKAYFFIFSFVAVACNSNQQPAVTVWGKEIVLSSIRGEKSKPSSAIEYRPDGKELAKPEFSLEGSHIDFWKVLIPNKVSPGQKVKIVVSFEPDSTFIGISRANLILNMNKETVLNFSLRGLSTKALEGKNEPPLADVVEALGYGIDLGWTSLGNHLKPELQGSEIPQSLFKKVGPDMVEMIPVARYSPRFSLPFGYYTSESSSPELHEIGALAMTIDYPEHQTLFPALEKGHTSFYPGNVAFGFYTTSPTHVAYSEDVWNESLYPEHATHACRIYEIKTSKGKIVPNQYLICFEEARNGDYQDYVFLVKNVRAIPVEM